MHFKTNSSDIRSKGAHPLSNLSLGSDAVRHEFGSEHGHSGSRFAVNALPSAPFPFPQAYLISMRPFPSKSSQ